MADNYIKEDFTTVFDRSRNLHFVEIKVGIEKPLPLELDDQYFTRQEFAKVAINNFVTKQKQNTKGVK